MGKKLRARAGMTLTELLVALLIVSMIGLVLTLGVNSAVKVYRDATRMYEAETLCGTILTYLEDEFRFGQNLRADGDTAVIDSVSFGSGAQVSLDGGKVTLGGFQLLADKAYTSGLQVSKAECKIDGGKVEITVAVGPDDTSTYVEHTVTVDPVAS